MHNRNRRPRNSNQWPPAEAEIRKQISIFVPLSEWKMIRHEAARKRIPMTELCRRWMRPGLERLKRTSSADKRAG